MIVDHAGTPQAVRRPPAARARGTGDYSFVVPAPLVDALAAPGSDSVPGRSFRRDRLAGVRDGSRRVLAADATLRARRVAAALPIQLATDDDGRRSRLESGERRSGHVEVRLEIRNRTAVQAQGFDAPAVPARIAPVLDRLRTDAARRSRRPRPVPVDPGGSPSALVRRRRAVRRLGEAAPAGLDARERRGGRRHGRSGRRGRGALRDRPDRKPALGRRRARRRRVRDRSSLAGAHGAPPRSRAGPPAARWRHVAGGGGLRPRTERPRARRPRLARIAAARPRAAVRGVPRRCLDEERLRSGTGTAPRARCGVRPADSRTTGRAFRWPPCGWSAASSSSAG